MSVTGGEISVEDSWWYMVECFWKKGNWEASDASLGYDLVAQLPDGLPISLKRLYVTEASEMLGMWIAPDDNKEMLIKNNDKLLFNEVPK